jgi:predicted RNA methylase
MGEAKGDRMNRQDAFDRLRGIGVALRTTSAGMAVHRERFAALAGRHEAGTAPKAVSSFNLFQTPATIAARMAQLVAAHATTGRVLEPSAGLGRIYKALIQAAPDARMVLVEESPECCAELYKLTEDRGGDRIYQRDFLELMPGDIGGEFDAICMNPPFKQGTDIKHINHALTMLTPGGLLVSLCYNGARQNAYIKERCDTWEVLPEGSFRAEGTTASVVLLTIHKATQGE